VHHAKTPRYYHYPTWRPPGGDLAEVAFRHPEFT
jgi:hypothetical protein